MIIGIDATSFSHPQPGGYKTYVANLLEAMCQLPSQHTFRIFLDREVPPVALAKLPGERGIVVSNRVPIFRQLLREQLQLPLRAAREHCALVHHTTNTAPVLSRVPYVLTLHDIIALTEPQAKAALSRQELWQWAVATYGRYVIPVAVKGSRAIITVSEFERQQITQHFGLSAASIHPIHLAANPLFQPMSQSQRKAARNRVTNAYGLDSQYIMAIGHEPRKNVLNVIRVYQLLEPSVRRRLSVLIVCARRAARLALQDRISSVHLDQAVRVVGGVSAEELLQIYSGAEALVFPSLRESFGLPPLEAMACGTPVVASNTTSVPEVVGDAGILVDPTNVGKMAEAVNRVLTVPGMADELRERGLARAAAFSWPRVAQATMAVYELAARA